MRDQASLDGELDRPLEVISRIMAPMNMDGTADILFTLSKHITFLFVVIEYSEI